MDIDDIVGVIGQFFSPRELFLYSRVSPIWNKNLIFHKKKIVKKIRYDTRRAHYLNNMCPCAIESVWSWADAKMRGVLVKNFKLNLNKKKKFLTRKKFTKTNLILQNYKYESFKSIWS